MYRILIRYFSRLGCFFGLGLLVGFCFVVFVALVVLALLLLLLFLLLFVDHQKMHEKCHLANRKHLPAPVWVRPVQVVLSILRGAFLCMFNIFSYEFPQFKASQVLI